MNALFYSASDIAQIICIHDLGQKQQTELLNQIWETDRMFLQNDIANDKKKFFLDVENYIHYFFDKVAIDAEFPVVLKDAEASGCYIENPGESEFDNMNMFFKNLRYRILFLESRGYVSMKIRTLMSHYGYKRRSPQFVEYLKKCLYFYHIDVNSKGYTLCDIGTESVDTMVTFRV